jgi:phosphate starvation-inducible protein PhoH and related proteins
VAIFPAQGVDEADVWPRTVVTLTIPIEQPDKRLALFGAADRNLRQIRELFNVQIAGRNDELRLSGETDAVGKAVAVLNQLQLKLRRKEWLSEQDIADAFRAPVDAARRSIEDGELDVFVRGRNISGRTDGQRAYVKAMLAHDLTFCEGPAGTGKTYLAVAVAAHLLKTGEAKRIVLARPAVEAGEKLGFLPGDLQAKVNPYLRPLFDSLHDMIDFEQVRRLIASDVIEVIPLAFMRGRTLNQACIILDEAQNCTVSQMLMFLTRLGEGSKMIVTGDATQLDLPEGIESGLTDALRRLRGIKQVALCQLDKADIVRHRLVQHIVKAYGELDVRQSNRTRRRPAASSSDESIEAKD